MYLAESEETAWAEMYRWLAEARRAPTVAMPRDLHHVTVDLERVADLRAERARGALRLPRMRPTRQQWLAFQVVGEALESAGAQGVLYASTARSRSTCLCVFEAGLRGLTAAGEPIRVITPPPVPRGLRT